MLFPNRAWFATSYFAIFFLVVLLLFLLPVLVNAQRGGTGGAGGAGAAANASATTYDPPGATRSGPPGMLGNVPTLHAEDESKVEFRSETVLVQIPVVVTDTSGKHLLDLKKDDFQLFENGKEQKITSFEAIVANHTQLPAQPSHPEEFSNVAAAKGEQPRSITVIALDTVNTPLLDQTYARKQLLKFLAQNLDASQTFGLVVITSRGLKVVQGLTGDSRQLIEALNKVSSEMPATTGVSREGKTAAIVTSSPDGMPWVDRGSSDPLQGLQDFVAAHDAPIAGFQQDRAIETTMQAFLGIAWSLSGFPGKKSVIWATGGMPFYLDSPSTVPGGFLTVLYERTMAALNQSDISVYPVDARGLVNFAPEADPTYQPLIRDASPTGAMKLISERSWVHYSTTDTLKDFAAMTGGRAFYNGNDIAGLFKRAADDSSSYYVLGYYLDTKNRKPGWRQLKVKVNEGRTVEVRARSGFFVTNATVDPNLSRKSDLYFAVTSPFDSTGLPLTVRWFGTSVDGSKKKVEFGLRLPPNSLTTGTRNSINFDYMATAYADKDGKTAGTFAKTIQGELSAERMAQLQSEGFAYKNELDLAPGQYTVRFVVRDNVTGRVGSVSAPLTVD